MPSQKDGIVSPAMAPTRMATSATPPRQLRHQAADGHREPGAEQRAPAG